MIRSQGSLYPITEHLNAAHFRSVIEKAQVRLHIRTPGGLALKRFDPDYLCFVRFALNTLLRVRDMHPDADKVDFLIEKNGHITKHIERFHASIPKTLRDELDRADLADLVGDLVPGGKDCVPLQAADLFCWYARNAMSLGLTDARYFYNLARRAGNNGHATEQEIDNFVARAAAADAALDDTDFEGIRGPSQDGLKPRPKS